MGPACLDPVCLDPVRPDPACLDPVCLDLSVWTLSVWTLSVWALSIRTCSCLFLLVSRAPVVGFGRNLVEMNPTGPPDLSKRSRALRDDQKTKKIDRQISRVYLVFDCF